MIGFYILLANYRLGLTEARAAWVVKLCHTNAVAATVKVGEFSEGLGRLAFVVEALLHEKPFLAPLYTFQGLHSDTATVAVPLFVGMILTWIGLRVKRRRTVPCAEKRVPGGIAFRVDAKAEGQEVAVGGWAPVVGADGRPNTKLSEWFAVRLTAETASWAFHKGEPFRSIMALELFATLTAVALLGPEILGAGNINGIVVLPAVGDNLGATQVIARGMSTRFPLNLVAMELSARLESMGARLEPQWAPREFNQEADDLSNLKTSAFDPAWRRGTQSAESIPLLLMPTLFKMAARLHDEKLAAKVGCKKGLVRRGRKRVKLKDRHPW